MPATNKGIFITLEGGEGTGKSTLAKSLVTLLEEQGSHVVLTREPGGCPAAETIRQLSLDPIHNWDPKTQLFLMSAARTEHVKHVIKPALEAGKIVVCDRFTDSTVVYQSYVGGLPRDEIIATNMIATDGLTPDYTFLLDLSVKEALARVQDRGGEKTWFDKQSVDFHERVRAGFLDVAQSNQQRIHVLAAATTPELLLQHVVLVIKERIKENI